MVGMSAEVKTHIATRILTLPDNAPELAAITALLDGKGPDQQENELLRLRDVSKRIGVTETWLCRLGVPARLGIPFGGSRRYRPSEVREWMQSEECRARVSELHKQRKAREAKKRVMEDSHA